VGKRNIVLITLDSLRADHCSFMGYERKTTPTIDKIARRSLCFKSAISPSTATPTSMISIFTGEHSTVDITKSTPGKDASFKPWRKELYQRRTLAQVLSENGYFTAAFTPNPFTSSLFGFNKGFKYYQDFLSISESKNEQTYININIFEKHLKGSRIFSYLRIIRNFIQKEEVFKPWESYYDDILNWVKKAREPFFLWILLLDTHHPYLPPKKFRKYSTIFDVFYYNLKLETNMLKTNPCDQNERKKLIDLYDDSIRYADAFIGRLLEDLKDVDPIFIIHADHGEGFCEHGYYSHPPYLYEESIHVPLVIYNADVKGKIEKPVSLLGLPSTILDLIGLENEFPSNSFLRGENDWVISQVFEDGKLKVAVRMKDWKFITEQKEEDELYYLKKDPYEQENLIDEYPDLAKEMRKIIKSHVKREMEKIRIQRTIQRLRGI